MAFLKKPEAIAADPFRVPSMAEAHPEYGMRHERVIALNDETRSLRAEENSLVSAIAADTTPALRPNVAALLGEEPSQKTINQRRLAEVRSQLRDVDDAIIISERRKRELESAASAAVCQAVRPEVQKRMSALLRALAEVETARNAVEEIVLAIEAEGAAPYALGPVRPFFLGEIRDGHIARFVREAKEAGYHG
jgi:glutathione S-transferase